MARPSVHVAAISAFPLAFFVRFFKEPRLLSSTTASVASDHRGSRSYIRHADRALQGRHPTQLPGCSALPVMTGVTLTSAHGEERRQCDIGLPQRPRHALLATTDRRRTVDPRGDWLCDKRCRLAYHYPPVASGANCLRPLELSRWTSADPASAAGPTT